MVLFIFNCNFVEKFIGTFKRDEEEELKAKKKKKTLTSVR